MRRDIPVGSQAHKELFCQFFLDTHVPFEPAAIAWPELEPDALERLRSLPFWPQAIATERATTRTIQTFAALQTDALLRHAITLQGYEEQRHAAMLQHLTSHYDIPVLARPEPPPPADAEWAFLCTGYSECFDTFFTFALFALARESGFFPPVLVECFEPIMQEEARHILFFVNWEAYCQARRPLWRKPRHVWRGVLGRGVQVWHRLRMACGMQHSGDFTLKGHQALSASISPRRFLELCLQENDKRLGRYDARLLRPRLVPALARGLSRLIR